MNEREREREIWEGGSTIIIKYKKILWLVGSKLMGIGTYGTLETIIIFVYEFICVFVCEWVCKTQTVIWWKSFRNESWVEQSQ